MSEGAAAYRTGPGREVSGVMIRKALPMRHSLTPRMSALAVV
jgi:hypothetical protein